MHANLKWSLGALQAASVSAMRSRPSLQVARALILGNPAGSPRTASQQLACSPRDEPISRQVRGTARLASKSHPGWRHRCFCHNAKPC